MIDGEAPDPLVYVIPSVIVGLCVILALTRRRRAKSRRAPAIGDTDLEPTGPPHYEIVPPLSSREVEVLHELQQWFGSRGIVLTCVPVRDVIAADLASLRREARTDYAYLGSTAFTFVVMDAETRRPLIAVSVDDPRVHIVTRHEEGSAVDRICAASGLPHARISDDPVEGARALRQFLETTRS